MNLRNNKKIVDLTQDKPKKRRNKRIVKVADNSLEDVDSLPSTTKNRKKKTLTARNDQFVNKPERGRAKNAEKWFSRD
ncbi:hypothetical protein BpHYR1_036555 [Brachionus plicatilis]|uniref:Uncharacterized protein n=1 Tax=Brachionus plicatilis TaxID=10195 RepID=A0A3M7PZ59_BRAPC|nr:hypothetical protein BpHYR1_036555 [Brachionus plicatilis]